MWAGAFRAGIWVSKQVSTLGAKGPEQKVRHPLPNFLMLFMSRKTPEAIYLNYHNSDKNYC